MKKKIILASKSPRRRVLLESLGLKFESIDSQLDETMFEISEPDQLVKVLAEAKAKAILDQVSTSALIVGSDTVVVKGQQIIGKPKNRKDAFRLLSMLSGKRHTVFTGLAILDSDTQQKYLISQQTNVYMRTLSEQEINAYIQTNEPLDKAGAYGIQGIGAVLIDRIEGDYYSVMGFPISKFYEGLKILGYDLFHLKE